MNKIIYTYFYIYFFFTRLRLQLLRSSVCGTVEKCTVDLFTRVRFIFVFVYISILYLYFTQPQKLYLSLAISVILCCSNDIELLSAFKLSLLI